MLRFFRTFLRTRKRVRQWPTRFSLVVVVMLFGLFFEAYMHNFNLVYITLFFVFAAAMSVDPPGTLNVGNLEAEHSHCGRLFANRAGRCFFQLHNPAKIHSYAIMLVCDELRTTIARIASGTTRTVALTLTPERRGRYTCESCRLESLFPLSTVRFVLQLQSTIRTVVFPEPKGRPLQDFLMRQRAPFGEEQDFDGLSVYTGGESLSRIHWPSVAKGEPAIKQFEKEHRTDTLIFDFFRCADNDEARLSQLSLWVIECEKADLPFMIRMPDQTLNSKKVSIDAILETLALY